MTKRNKFNTLTLERVLVEIRERGQILEGETQERASLINEIQELSQFKEALESGRIQSLIRSTGNNAAECKAALIRFGWDVKMARETLSTPRHMRSA